MVGTLLVCFTGVTYWCIRLIDFFHLFMIFLLDLELFRQCGNFIFLQNWDNSILFCLHYSDIVRIDQPLRPLYFVCIAKMLTGQTLNNAILFWYWFDKYITQRELLNGNINLFGYYAGTTSWKGQWIYFIPGVYPFPLFALNFLCMFLTFESLKPNYENSFTVFSELFVYKSINNRIDHVINGECSL